NKDNNQEPKNDDKQDDSDQENDQQQSPSGMSDEQRNQILNAIQAQEDKTQDKIEGEKKKALIIPGKKNW
ncbi:MAG: hypothetical protein Q4F45_08185, partial [Alistipes sp.]|nr:hypothetical protein [Alistipes sp.]